MRKILSGLLLAALSMSPFAGAQSRTQTTFDDPVINAIAQEGQNNNQVQDHLRHLTTKVGPRLTGSKNLTRAMTWATEQMNSWGLEAEMEKWGTFPIGFDRGRVFGRIASPVKRRIEFASKCWSAGTTGVQKGPLVLRPKTADEVRSMADKIRGAWVMADNAGGGRRGRGRRRGADTIREALLEAGALGLITPGRNNQVYTMGGMPRSMEACSKLPLIEIRKDDHDQFMKWIEAGENVELEFNIENHIYDGPVDLFNVIGMIKGTEFPDEYVIIGGHCDSWDGAQGCTDNGTGSSTTLEAARLVMQAVKKTGQRPRRTILFQLYSGEEQGLLGSAGWVKAHADKMPNVSAVFVHDMGTNYLSGVTCTERMKDDFSAVFAPVVKLNAEFIATLPQDERKEFKVNTRERLSVGGGSDHSSFLQKGVPGFFWSQAGRAVYNYSWHTQNDTFEVAIPHYQQHSSMVAAMAAWGFANLDHKLDRFGMFPPRLGASFDRDMVITAIQAGSAAERAGLKTGDKILKMAGRTVANRRAVRRAIGRLEGRELKMVISRATKEVELMMSWGEEK